MLRLKPGMRVLEIGSGWGACALYPAREHGCQVVSVTISQRQHEAATRRVKDAGLERLIDIRLQDYRDIRGQFDRLISIEMIEAVGAEYLGLFLRTLQQTADFRRIDGAAGHHDYRSGVSRAPSRGLTSSSATFSRADSCLQSKPFWARCATVPTCAFCAWMTSGVITCARCDCGRMPCAGIGTQHESLATPGNFFACMSSISATARRDLRSGPLVTRKCCWPNRRQASRVLRRNPRPRWERGHPVLGEGGQALAASMRSTVETDGWQGGSSKQERGKRFCPYEMGIMYIM